MRGVGIALFIAGWIGPMQSGAFGQSLLEQLEKKVRDGIELAAPKDKPADASKPPAQTETELLPAPTPPPPPSPSATPGAKGSDARSSILEPPGAAQQPSDSTDAAAKTYLGLEAESLTGGGIGARVVAVTENSPAWRAGFKVNDVILAIDGYAIANLDNMVERLTPRRAGEAIKALVLRGGRNIELTAVLQSAAVAQRIQNGSAVPDQPPAASGAAWLGVAVADLSTAFRNQFGLRVYRAAAVTNVTKNSPADSVKILPGDAIVSADGRLIESARDLLDWVASKRPGDRVSLTVMRGTRTTTFDLTLTVDPKTVVPKTVVPPARKPVLNDPFTAPSSTGDLNLGEYEDTAVGRVVADNTVPPPPGSELSELEQLREELRATREQISTLEQRILELENRLEPKPQ